MRTNPLGGDCGGDFSGDDINPSSSCSVTRVFSAAAFFLHGLLAIAYTYILYGIEVCTCQ